MIDFVRFPHTPHLAWLGRGKPRVDKVLTDAEADVFLSSDVIVEEKIDGANLGFSVDDHGTLRAQSRGSYLDLDGLVGQWKPLARWLSTRRYALTDALAPNLMLFGEWCYAVHSVRYSQLPDWFLAFDVYDRATDEFWSVARRDELAAALHIPVVPGLGLGRFDMRGLKKLVGRSRLGEGWAEGLYVRREVNGRLIARAKLVRAEFIQAIDEHWSTRSVEPNQLAIGRKALV
jgi:ATP-dependent RNA circularization protein (DNA/RNA ligase family)